MIFNTNLTTNIKFKQKKNPKQYNFSTEFESYDDFKQEFENKDQL